MDALLSLFVFLFVPLLPISGNFIVLRAFFLNLFLILLFPSFSSCLGTFLSVAVVLFSFFFFTAVRLRVAMFLSLSIRVFIQLVVFVHFFFFLSCCCRIKESFVVAAFFSVCLYSLSLSVVESQLNKLARSFAPYLIPRDVCVCVCVAYGAKGESTLAYVRLYMFCWVCFDVVVKHRRVHAGSCCVGGLWFHISFFFSLSSFPFLVPLAPMSISPTLRGAMLQCPWCMHVRKRKRKAPLTHCLKVGTNSLTVNCAGYVSLCNGAARREKLKLPGTEMPPFL